MAHFEGLSLSLRKWTAQIKYLGVFTYPIATFLTFENWRLPKAKIHGVHVLVDYTYADIQISNIVSEYLRKNKKVHKIVLAYL